jgi:predicted ATPase
MQILHQSGKRNQALLHFHDFQSRLQKTLNIGAEEETLLQAQTIRASACDRDGGAPPLTEKALFSHQDINHSLLPDASLPFFNRGDEIECVVDLLESREHRVIVLKGVIGAGKTRLAMQVAERVKRTWTDHVHMVMINHHQHPNLVSAMIQALGIPSANSSDHRKNLIQYLRNKESLIILDNLGELPDQADVILSLAYQCPKVKFIATTHRHLGIRGEQVIQVNGLAHPRPADVPEFQSDQEREAFIHQYSALALFYEVARRAKAGFAVDAGELRAVVDICDMLMGLPLAIEMAASFVRIFNGYQIRDGVYGCLHGNRDMAVFVAGRQGSFVKRFEAVWDTLSPVERELIKRINQFADGVDTRQLLEDRAGSFETLIGLLDKSALISLPDQRVKLHPLTRFFACP